MGGQGIERREILRYIGIASVAGTFPGFHQWAFACAGDPAHPDSVHAVAATEAGTKAYASMFFSQPQYQMVERMAEMIIPADDTPGAREVGVAEFIDFMVANRVPVNGGYEVRSVQDSINQGKAAQAQFIAGLHWMDAHCHAEFGKPFMECSAEQQNQLLEELAYKKKFTPTTETGREFFQMMRDYTVIGYYTTKIGLESLGYPGLRRVWPKMPGCTHLDDPEHVHLHEPRT